MTSKLALLLFLGRLAAQQPDWIAAGHRAFDRDNSQEAAADFERALQANLRAGVPAADLLHLRVTLATAYMEAGDYRNMEIVLREAQDSVVEPSGISKAEILNAWSALHLKLGQLSDAEADLQQARRIVQESPNPGDLLPTVLHNLAAVEMRLGRSANSLDHEQTALGVWEKTLPSDHPALIRAWASLASLQYLMDRAREAQSSIQRALAAAETRYGLKHPIIADLLESEAVVLDKLKSKKDARQARERALKIRAATARPARDSLAWSAREATPPGESVYLRSK